MKKSPIRNSGAWRAAGLVSAVGVNIAVCTLLGFYGGGWLGEWLGGGPIWSAIGVLIGIFVGFVGAFMMIRKVLEEPNE